MINTSPSARRWKQTLFQKDAWCCIGLCFKDDSSCRFFIKII